LKKLIPFFLLLATICNAQIVQEDFSEDEAFKYKSEFTAGIMFNTVGGIPGGIRVKYAWQRKKKPTQLNNLALEIVNIRHPKELRQLSDSGSGSFIPEKLNFLFVIRPSIGREFLLFRKSSEDGIELKLITNAGISFGLMKPYYILVSTGGGKSTAVAYQPGTNTSRIMGNSFFSGFDQTKLVMGLNVRATLELGMSAWDKFVTGVELGFQAEAFTQRIQIMNADGNRQFFTSALINIYFGKRTLAN
jgi:hypothetical protein